jgi:hypothetical protein
MTINSRQSERQEQHKGESSAVAGVWSEFFGA